MTTETASTNIIASVVKLSEGYVLQLAEGRTVGYPTVVALGKGLVRELRRKPKPAAQLASAAAVNVQWFNLARLCDAAMAGEITMDDFERGLQTACPDAYWTAEAKPAIDAARKALAETRGNPVIHDTEVSPRPNKRAAKDKPKGPVPWICGYCKRASDCLFDTGSEMDLRAGIDSPCDVCQRCLDDSCGGEEAAQSEALPGYEQARRAVADEDELDMPPEVRIIVDNTGKRVGSMNVSGE